MLFIYPGPAKLSVLYIVNIQANANVAETLAVK